MGRRILEQRWINLGLRAKMSLLVEVGVVALILVFMFLGISQARQSSRQILTERMHLARLSAAILDANLRQVDRILEHAAQRHIFTTAETLPADTQAALEDAYSQFSNVGQSLYLLDMQGKPLFQVGRSDLPVEWGSLAISRQPAGAGDATPPSITLTSPDEPWAAIATPVLDDLGRQAGWLAAVIDFSGGEWAPFTNMLDFGGSGRIDLVEQDGRLLFSSQPGYMRRNSRPDPNAADLFLSTQPSVQMCIGCAAGDAAEGGDEVIAFAPLQMAPWGVVVRQKASDLVTPVNRLLFQTLLLGLATIAGALLMVWVTTESVIRPVQMLQAAAHRISEGDYTTPMEELSSGILPGGRRRRRDEVGALAESFEAMRMRLQSAMDEVQALNRDLDQRVQERTQQAVAAEQKAQQARDLVLRRNQQLSTLNAIAVTANQSLNLQDILERSLEAVLRLTSVDVGALFLADDFSSSLRLMVCQGLSAEAAAYASEFGMLDGSCGGMMDHGHLVVVPDLSRYRGKRARSLQSEDIHTLVHVPLTAKGIVLGSMCVGTHEAHEYAPEEQELLTAMGSQIAVAIENARLYAEVQQKEHMRGELFKKALNAQEDERKRIARELHDETSQALAALLYALEDARETTTIRAARSKLDAMHGLLQHTLDGVHKVIFDLRPSMLDHLGLTPALRSLVKARLESQGMRVDVQAVGGPRRLSPEMEIALYRVAQEAVSNIARHAAARNVNITCQLQGPVVQLCIEDDGIGFDMYDLNLAPDNPRGLGLLGMQERLELLGGRIEIVSTPGQGTRLHIFVPLEDTPPDE